ncbi:hypothetical protein pdam_00017141 [Pocillopora damicornis]|uniref:EGF-like domain-containing protein n=1 Tax=Pocillopora damicornis TaxID=46731 RepID=A0A3M6U4H4_POCDA|nr:hypothetical protein pdam_00017141 [Pocillopora damicornis]
MDVVIPDLQKPMDIHVFDPSLISSDLFQKTSDELFLLFAEANHGEIYKVPLAVANTPCYLLQININISRPVAVDYDPVEGKIYFTDVTLKLLARAFPNGSSVEVIAHTDVVTPDGLAIDYIGRILYWTDTGTSKLEMRSLHPFGVALIPPFLFFTDWVTDRELHMLDATTGDLLKSFSINGGRPMGIVAYDSGRQPAGPCSVNNGGCSHFCVPKASNHECVCPTGLAVKQDGKTCEEKVKRFILFADADDKSTNIISLDVSYFVAQTLFNHVGNQRPIALDYDPVEDRVYWSDVAQGLIVSAFTNATSLKILFRCNILSPEGLVIDHVARNIYWTDTGTNRIEVARLDGSGRKELINTGLDEPRAIILDERNGQVTIFFKTEMFLYPLVNAL